MQYIYRITNLVNQKTYIGQRTCSCLPEEDIHYLGSGNLIKKAVKKYGKENFKKEILEEFKENLEIHELGEKEIFYIRKEREKGHSEYNISDGGTVPRLSCENNPAKRPDVREKISIALKGKRKGISVNKGRKHTEEFKAKISRSLIGNQRAKGHKLTDEAKEKIAAKLRGKSLSEEHKRKISERAKGRTIPEDQKKKISETLKGHPGYFKGGHLGEDSKQKIGENTKAAFRLKWDIYYYKVLNEGYRGTFSEFFGLDSRKKRKSKPYKRPFTNPGYKKLPVEIVKEIEENTYKRQLELYNSN